MAGCLEQHSCKQPHPAVLAQQPRPSLWKSVCASKRGCSTILHYNSVAHKQTRSRSPCQTVSIIIVALVVLLYSKKITILQYSTVVHVMY